MIENFDKTETELINQLIEKTNMEYGLKYDIITINNGSATLIPSNQSLNLQQSSMNTSQATPLALARAYNGQNVFLRCDFNYNSNICDIFNKTCRSNVKYVWKWFECN